MKILLDTAKAHLRVDSAFEDALIADWIDAAYLVIEGKIFRKIYDGAVPQADATGIVANPAINAAAQLIVGELYSIRESQTERPLTENKAVDMLLTPYVNFVGGA